MLRIFQPKCCFCGKKQSADPEQEFRKVQTVEIYDNTTYHFHPACLLKVASSPYSYNSTKVDLAVSIMDMLEEEKRRQKKQQEVLNHKRDELRKKFVKVFKE
jgi:hypothetical protein